MKKVISMLIIFIMIVSLAACGNKDNTNGNAGGNEITAGADNKKDTEPTKAPAATAAPEPTKEVQPTAEPTAEPEPTEEPDDPDIDEDDDIWDNPFIVSPDDNDYGDGGDYGDGFGAEFTLEDQEFIDVIATTYYGVYCQSADDPMVGTYYPYYGDEMSMETMDESNAAFLYLGMEEDQGQLCFLEKGMNEDVTWSLGKDEFGTYILLDDGYTGEVYKGRFYWDYENTRILVMIRIGEYDLWLTNDTRVIADTSSSRTMDEETALRAIEKYLAENDESMYEKLQTGDYGTADGVYTDEENGTIVVWLRTYTGAYRNYYIDPDSGETYVTETSPLTDNSVETPTDETLNAWDYAD